MANAPLSGRDGGDLSLIWGGDEAEYFFREDWTGQIRLNCFNKSSFPRNAREALIRRAGASATPGAPDAAASTASRPYVRDDGQRPSRNGMAEDIVLICPTGEVEYFS